jgi:hypothetical protein
VATTKGKTCIRYIDDPRYGSIAPNTRLCRIDADTLAVQFYTTNILLIHRDGTYTYNNGGYNTPTTKERLNRFGPLNIWQHKHQWQYLDGDGQVREYDNFLRVDVHSRRAS